MKYIDRLLQNWRIKKAVPHINSGSQVLDIGCGKGELFKYLNNCIYLGLDPDIESDFLGDGFNLKRGYFPQDFISNQKFDAIVMLAVLEHVPESAWDLLSAKCYELLNQKGKIIITVPDTRVDFILELLLKLRLIDGMKLEEHHGFKPEETTSIFEKNKFKLLSHKKFQLGLNNLFVFEKIDHE